MTIENNYYDIGVHHLGLAERLKNSADTNLIGLHLQQAVETLLKSALEREAPDNKALLNSHKISRIAEILGSLPVFSELDEDSLRLINDIYYETRYLGDGFTNLSTKNCARCFKTAHDVFDAVNTYRKDLGLPVKYIVQKTESVLSEYFYRYNIVSDEERYAELIRLSKLAGTKDFDVLKQFIKENFL